VVAAITKAAGVMTACDIFWLTYSGHGGQVPDRNGDEATADAGEIGETADRYDETWVLYDRMLVDDELWALWSLFPAKARIVMLSDSCHSGTVSRAPLGPGTAPARKASVASRRMPLDVEERTYSAHRRTYDRIQRSVSPRSTADVKATIELVSGCQDNQESLDGRVNGLFTEQLLKTWNDGAFKGSVKRLRDVVSKRMPPTQTPNYYVVGPTNRAFLSSRAFSI
jgi:metacaspase-1